MANEALQKIKEAEDLSSKNISDTHAEALKILEDAKIEINKINDVTKERALKEKEQTSKKALEDAKKSYEPVLLDFKKEIASLSSINEAKFEKAVNTIIERIVNN